MSTRARACLRFAASPARYREHAPVLGLDQIDTLRHVLAVFGAERARGNRGRPAQATALRPRRERNDTMEPRIMFGPVRSLRWAATAMVATGFVLGGAIGAGAQQQPAAPTQVAPAPAAPAKPAAKPQAKKPAAAPAQAAPSQAAPAQAPAQQTQAGAGPQQLPLVYSPWTKICGKDQKPDAKEVCLVIKEARLE